MIFYLFVMIISVIVGLVIADSNREVDVVLLCRKHMNSSTLYCMFFAIFIIILIGLRANSVGSDTINYYNSYQFDKLTIKDLLFNYSSYLKEGLLNFFSEKNSNLFRLICLLLKRIGFSFNGCLTVFAFIYVVPIIYLISKESDNVWKSCFWFIIFNLSIALSGVRISLALGLTAIAYICLLKNKKVISVIFATLALMIHLSAVVYIFVYIIKYIKLSKKSLPILLLAFLCMPLIGRVVTPLFIGFTYYQDSQDLPWNLPIYLFFSITSLLFIWAPNEDKIEYYKMIILGTIVCGLINYGAFGNMHKYFTQYLCICLPGLLKTYNKHTRIFIEVLYIITGLYLFFRTYSASSLVPYEFFWQ